MSMRLSLGVLGFLLLCQKGTWGFLTSNYYGPRRPFLLSSYSNPQKDKETLQEDNRTPRWLEESTQTLLNKQTPLTVHDVDDSCKGYMAAWAKRGKPLMVEQLLLKVINDLRQGNTKIQVTTKFYAMAMDAWANSGLPGSAERAQSIHDAMIAMYNDTQNVNMAPTVVSYNMLVKAWSLEREMAKAEAVLEEMLRSTDCQPNDVTLSFMLMGYARTNPVNAIRAQELFDMAIALNMTRTFYLYGALQNVYAKSRLPEAPNKTLELLHQMQKQQLELTVVNYNSVLKACSESPSVEAAHLATKLLFQDMPEAGVDANRASYLYTLYACAHNSTAPVTAERILDLLEVKALNKEFGWSRGAYNAILEAWANSSIPHAVEKATAILHRMTHLADTVHEMMEPDRRDYNSILNALVRTTHPGSHNGTVAERALELLHQMRERNVQPDMIAFTCILILYQRSTNFAVAAHQVDSLIREMEELYEEGLVERSPDVVHYTIALATWARVGTPESAHRCSTILQHMMERHEEGYENCFPNIRTYNAFIDALSRSGFPERAEKVLYYMLDQYRRGNKHMAPDVFSFDSVIISFIKSKQNGSGQRAESVLERLIEYSEEENRRVVPDERSFSALISFYSKFRNSPDAPYRAEFILNRLIDICRSGVQIKGLTSESFTTVIDSFAGKQLRDGGQRAERLLQIMKELKKTHRGIRVDSNVLSSVMVAWANSGDEQAAKKAEYHLDAIEATFAAGNKLMRPDSRCYAVVLSAWTRSQIEGKAKRALSVLRRMEEQTRTGNRAVRPDAFVKSLVINACSFSNASKEDERDAFQIASQLFEEMLNSRGGEEMLSLTFAWYIQLLGRHDLPENERIEQVERSFQKCSEMGLVTKLVISRLKGATSPELYRKLLEGKDANNLPPEWTRNVLSKRSEEKRWLARILW